MGSFKLCPHSCKHCPPSVQTALGMANQFPQPPPFNRLF